MTEILASPTTPYARRLFWCSKRWRPGSVHLLRLRSRSGVVNCFADEFNQLVVIGQDKRNSCPPVLRPAAGKRERRIMASHERGLVTRVQFDGDGATRLLKIHGNFSIHTKVRLSVMRLLGDPINRKHEPPQLIDGHEW